MRWKSTLVLFAAVIIIGAYLSLYELKQPTSQESERQSRYALRLDRDAITQIVLDLPKAKATLTRQENGWSLSPHNVRADSGMVNQILTVASALSAQRVITPSAGSPLALSTFGLEPATGSISLTANGAVATLFIGDATPIGSSQYMKRSDRPDVFIVDGQFFKVLDKPVEALRDVSLIHMSAAQCKGIELRSTAASWQASNSGEGWQLSAPVADKADQQAIAQFLSELERLTIRKFINDMPAETLPVWGLDHPKAEIILQASEGGATTTLVFGNPLPDDPTLIYAKRSDEPPIYAVALTEVNALLKDASALRTTKLFTFFTANVTQVSQTWSGAAWAIEKNGKSEWIVPGSTEALNRARVEELLNALADGRAAGFDDGNAADLKRYGLDAPIGTVKVVSNSAPAEQELWIGAAVAESNERYGRIGGRAAVLILPQELVTTLAQTTLQSLKAEPPAPAPKSP